MLKMATLLLAQFRKTQSCRAADFSDESESIFFAKSFTLDLGSSIVAGFVKKMFADTSENKDMLFASINSINWTRILAQTVYFFYLSSRIDQKEINVSIPSARLF